MKSKNRILLIGIIVYVLLELMIYMPGDIMSPGYSIIYNKEESIDNYGNVMNYPYSFNTFTRSHQNYYALKDLPFYFLDSINIPGMPETKQTDYENNYIFSQEQYPQGICITEDYFLLTSYSGGNDCLGELMVFDKDSGAYLLTLGMDEKSHLGGIAYDGENVWVCNSYNNTLERISYDTIRLMVLFFKGNTIDITNLVDEYQVEYSPSCVSYYNGSLWIATHNIWTNSKMVEYRYDMENDELIWSDTYRIPSQVQGITFNEHGEVFLSMSYGRRNSSFIRKYDSVHAMNYSVDHYSAIIEMPPCSEEITYHDNALYILFESAGEKYLEGTDGLGQSICPLDKILVIDLTSP